MNNLKSIAFFVATVFSFVFKLVFVFCFGVFAILMTFISQFAQPTQAKATLAIAPAEIQEPPILWQPASELQRTLRQFRMFPVTLSHQQFMRMWFSQKVGAMIPALFYLLKQSIPQGSLVLAATASSEATPVTSTPSELAERPTLLVFDEVHDALPITIEAVATTSPEVTPASDPFGLDGLSKTEIHAYIDTMDLTQLKKLCVFLNKQKRGSITGHARASKALVVKKLKAYFK